MFPYFSLTGEDEKDMLTSINLNTMEDLFSDIPEDLRLSKPLNLGNPMSELEVASHISNVSAKNRNIEDLTCFLGAGAYDHYIPSIIKHITSRSEFYTAYTPYQPEISQGTLQVIFEYQSMIAELTGMAVANASMYDGATACAEAAILATDSTRRKSIVVSKTVHPETRAVLKTYMKFRNLELIEVDFKDGETDVDKLKEVISKDTAGVILQNPNFFGVIEDVSEIEKITHENKSLLVMSVDPISLGILKTPGELGADIVVGEGQSLGNALNFGGPYIGFMATTSKLMRKLPGRIVGETVDLDGKRAFVLTLQAREQHIKRHKASSNICSNQALNALVAAVYLTTLGKEGIKEVAQQSMKKAHYTFNELIKTGKFKPLFDKPFFKEFAISSETSTQKLNDELYNNGILGGYSLETQYPTIKNSLLICVTEKRTKDDIERLANIMGGVE
ncbi:aminomethyl-transferring glycine dehydrogenase subunit GcvPA [Clostridium sp.]|uniref:aminomethyl-transferring glycine dehydrogenase subunit GcvPA n=1 Tax=Clostridium sp. TaxID=1506 RepID=UPI002FCB7B3A